MCRIVRERRWEAGMSRGRGWSAMQNQEGPEPREDNNQHRLTQCYGSSFLLCRQTAAAIAVASFLPPPLWVTLHTPALAISGPERSSVRPDSELPLGGTEMLPSQPLFGSTGSLSITSLDNTHTISVFLLTLKCSKSLIILHTTVAGSSRRCPLRT